jgi:hypothetical protein
MAQSADNPEPTDNQPQPGTVISPGGAPPPPAKPEPAQLPTTPEPPLPAAEQPETPAPETPEPQREPIEPVADDDGQANPSVTWTASEFVAHDKSAGWYILLAAGTLVLAVVVFLLTRDVISVSVVVVAGLLLGVYAGHQPRQLDYSLDDQGFGIGQKHYGYDEFKWFSVMEEGAFSGIVFMPLKRFAPPVTIYYPPQDEDKILTTLTNQLPMEEHKADAVDSLMRRIRF